MPSFPRPYKLQQYINVDTAITSCDPHDVILTSFFVASAEGSSDDLVSSAVSASEPLTTVVSW